MDAQRRRRRQLTMLASGASATYPATNLKLDLDSRFGTITTSGGSTPAVADGDPVGKWVDQALARTMVQATAGARPTLKLNQVNGLPSVRFDGTDDKMTLNALLGNALIANNAYEWFIVINATTISTNGASGYTNDGVFGSDGGYWGLTLRSTPLAYVYNDDGAEDKASVAISTGAWMILNCRHESGTIYISKDGGAEASVASGNTANIAQSVSIGVSTAAPNEFFAGDMARLLCYNVPLTLAERTASIAYLKALYGIP